VTPFSKNIARSLQKEPKYYFYDTGMVKGDDGARLENLVACSLLKEVDRLADVEGHDMGIHFIRDKDGREVDFAITLDNEAINLIEVKTSDDSVSKHLRRFLPSSDLKRTQIVKNLDHARSFPDGLRVEPLTLFLSQMELI
jgi:predicted AAA+ superfamily ATPase